MALGFRDHYKITAIPHKSQVIRLVNPCYKTGSLIANDGWLPCFEQNDPG
jgi:hypothetical protein